MDFSEKITKMRKANGLSQEELAERLEVSRQSISKWETGQASPDLDKVVKLAKIFDVSADYLLQPSETDELTLKTAILEKQQQSILTEQHKMRSWSFLIVSSVISLIAIIVIFLIGRYIVSPDIGDGYASLGHTFVYGGILVVIAITVILNYRHRARFTNQNDNE